MVRGEQVEALEHEAEEMAPQQRALVAPQRPDVDALEADTIPSVGVSRQPMMFIAVDLPEPDGPMMATNSPRVDLQVDAGERVHGRVARAVDLGDARNSISGSGMIDRPLHGAPPHCLAVARRR